MLEQNGIVKTAYLLVLPLDDDTAKVMDGNHRQEVFQQM
jgi:hypothetical protein